MEHHFRVPVIDMREADEGRDPKFAAELGAACEHIGFAVLVNHDLDTELLARMYAAMERLFALPVKVLQRYETPENGRQTGYTSPLVERAVGAQQSDLKAFYHVRRDLPLGHPGRNRQAFVPNIWPDEIPEFRQLSLAIFTELDRLGTMALRALNAYLGLPHEQLPQMIVDGETLLRQLYYPPVDPELARQGYIRAGAHGDINLVTLLPAATEPGLEVKPREGDWFSVDETPGSVVLNVGDMLQLFTKGRLVSTAHRVVNPPGETRRRATHCRASSIRAAKSCSTPKPASPPANTSSSVSAKSASRPDRKLWRDFYFSGRRIFNFTIRHFAIASKTNP